jgi:GNAT superfamily N-acetyltransferase
MTNALREEKEDMYTHNHPYTTLLAHLHAHLPLSGPLYRRIQYQVSHPSPTARVLASFEESELSQETETRPWLAAYVDIPRGPDTQIWLYSSIESESGDSESGAPATATAHSREIVKAHLLSLFTHIQRDLVPDYISSLPTTLKAPTPVVVDEGVPKIPAHKPTSYLLGTVHTTLEALIIELRNEGKLTILRGAGVHYVKYCFSSKTFDTVSLEDFNTDTTTTEDSSSSGYRFHDSTGQPGIQGHHIDLVKSRTNIPRSREALLAMGGVALYHSSQPVSSSETEKEMPIGWAFLGFDGSLCSLHVEPEHRGRGLAGVVGREVMKRGVEVFEPTDSSGPRSGGDLAGRGGEEWFFADVAVENAASRRVMEKMGGVARWRVAWMVVEVENLEKQ